MSGFGRKITAAAVAMSLCAVPTAAIGAAPSAAPVAASQSVAAPSNPWLTLSAMTTSSSAAAAAAAAQNDDGPGFPPIPPLVVILATIAAAIYILAKGDDHNHLHIFQPISPA